ncbi:mannose-6-phosphate isomerase, class I [Vibrio sp. UCD-FRSSP16_10]|uniref:mannose-6-phosphate isomerase, class I n=1 Tax=unclassified Vibrio TaxID=2614977 RepID=UPI000800615D|nr:MULTISPECIES: mannose-6-phosphate isomerase, class I [unclassified Vibrio]OBT16346.1 mannose-6-phosphate isomerase, class I [Vibrio sp. UCD-FRSSP16_30]OBT21211.1 mannose-6-phosphate isomerase, class I [Vibrio sp. UCD-FRSSP16_10]
MHKSLFKLNNVIQNYPWGSKTSIATLFGYEDPDHLPQAEIWMGAHPNGCSKICVDTKEVLLSEFISENKRGVLSGKTAARFGELPFLFKVLAAGKALSIQVHPSKSEAEAGFAMENAKGIDLKSSCRNYRDPNHKPELVYALTPYQAMNGFRGFNEVVSLFSNLVDQVEIPDVERLLVTFEANRHSKGLKAFFTGILSLEGQKKTTAIDALLKYCRQHQQPNIQNNVPALILELGKSYPEDIGLFAPMMLNVLTLKPGEVMYLDARTPHAYLKGTALEVMANSDNVLRAGLTPKHIDIDELVRCTSFKAKPRNTLILAPSIKGNRYCYATPVSDFKFDCFQSGENEHIQINSAEILFAIDGDVSISCIAGESIYLKKGESVFIPAYVKFYTLNASGRVARVYN